MTMTSDDVPAVDTSVDPCDARIAARRSYLVDQLATLPSIDQLPASATQADLDANRQRRLTLERDLDALNKAAADVTQLGSAEDDEAWLTQLRTWRQILVDELKTHTAYSTRNPKIKGRQNNLIASIKCIDRGPQAIAMSDYSLVSCALGKLMIEAGFSITGADPSLNYEGVLPWFGALPEVEQRLESLATKRKQAQAALEYALLDEETRAQQEADAAALRKAMNDLIVTINAEGTGLAAYRNRQALLDGLPITVEEMSPLEQRAFERLAATFRF
jgi:hypothetical protein